MEHIKTYPVVSEWYQNKLSGKVARFAKSVAFVAVAVLVLVQIASMLQTQALKNAQLQNLIKYHNVDGFKPVK